MADKSKFLSYTGLGHYDEKIKEFAQGLVDKVKADIIDGAPEAYNTLKEVSDYIASHTSEYEALVALVGDKATKDELNTEIAKITALQTAVTTLNDNENNADSVDGKIKALKNEIDDALNAATSAVQSVTTGNANGTIKVDDTEVAVKGLGSAAYTSADAYEVAGAAQTLADGAVATNTSDITELKGKVTALEAAEPEAITNAEIDALFTTVEDSPAE